MLRSSGRHGQVERIEPALEGCSASAFVLCAALLSVGQAASRPKEAGPAREGLRVLKDPRRRYHYQRHAGLPRAFVPQTEQGRRGRRGHPFGRGSRRRPSPRHSPCGRRQGSRSGLDRLRSSIDGFVCRRQGVGRTPPVAILAKDVRTVVERGGGSLRADPSREQPPAACAASVVQRGKHRLGGCVGQTGCVCALAVDFVGRSDISKFSFQFNHRTKGEFVGMRL